MKKIITILCFVTTLANGQEFKFGAKAGLNLVTITNKDRDIKMGAGFLVGGLVTIPLNEKWSLQPELYFGQGKSENTNSVSIDDVNFSSTQEVKISNLSLPVLFQYKVYKNLSVQVGPQLDYFLSANSYQTTVITDPTEQVSYYSDTAMDVSTTTFVSGNNQETVAHDYELNDLNLSGTIGLQYLFNKGFFVDARYNIGLTSFSKNADANNAVYNANGISVPEALKTSVKDVELKASAIQLSIGYYF